jgi:hypothetical protein
VDEHGRHESRVVHLNTRHGVGHDKAAPLRMDGRVIRQESKDAFHDSGRPVGFRSSQAETTAGRGGARADAPELDQVLGREAEPLSLLAKAAHGRADEGVISVRWNCEPQEDVGVRKVRHQS